MTRLMNLLKNAGPLKLWGLLMAAAWLFAGCASLPTADNEYTRSLLKFDPPPADQAGIYVYRDSSPFGAGLYKDIYIDGICLGETARSTFFYQQVKGNEVHEIATESELSPNALTVFMEGGKNYYFRQYIRLGVFVGGAELEQIEDETAAQNEIRDCHYGIPGTCSSYE